MVVDGPDLADRVSKETGGADIKLGIDAVGGAAIGRLIDCVGEGGTVVNYGLLSGEACQINAFNFVFRDIRLVGFWLAKVMRGLSFSEILAMYEKLAARLLDGTIHVESVVLLKCLRCQRKLFIEEVRWTRIEITFGCQARSE